MVVCSDGVGFGEGGRNRDGVGLNDHNVSDGVGVGGGIGVADGGGVGAEADADAVVAGRDLVEVPHRLRGGFDVSVDVHWRGEEGEGGGRDATTLELVIEDSVRSLPSSWIRRVWLLRSRIVASLLLASLATC